MVGAKRRIEGKNRIEKLVGKKERSERNEREREIERKIEGKKIKSRKNRNREEEKKRDLGLETRKRVKGE